MRLVTTVLLMVLEAWPGSKGAAALERFAQTHQATTTGGGGQENAYCTIGDVCNFGSPDGPANPPSLGVYTGIDGTPTPGIVRTAQADCSDLQEQVNAANPGDIVEIPATANCRIHLTLPIKATDIHHWVWIRSQQYSNPNFPAEGVRATPCAIHITHIDSYPDYACASPGVLMPTLTVATTNTTVISFATGAHHYRLTGLNVTKTVGVTMSGALIALDKTDHIILDRMLIHGVDYSAPNKFDTHIGVSMRGTFQAIINSWLYDIDWNQADGYCVGGGTGTQADEGPLKIYNNLLACSSESWIFGGGAAIAVPHDFEIRYNLSMKPLKWMMPQGTYSYMVAVNVKNNGEWKQGNRVLMEYNIFTNDWEGQSDQYGSLVLMMPKSQSVQDTSKYVNTNGTAVSCASDATGTACTAGTGIWGNSIISMSRTAGIVTLNGANNGGNIRWPYYNAGSNIVLQGIPHTLAGTVYLDTLNGEYTMGCLNASTCTDGYNHPRVIYLSAPGPDFPLTNTGGGLAQDFTSQSCAWPGHCVFQAPKVNYPTNSIQTVVDSEHITVANDEGTQRGVTQVSCHPGNTPNAELFDFIARYNYLVHAENIGFVIGNVISQCQDVGKGGGRISIHDNVADDIDTTAWDRGVGSCCGHGGQGPSIANQTANTTLYPHDILFAHNTWAGLRGWPSPVAWFSSSGFSFSDAFNVTYKAATLRRMNNVVTITFSAKSGAAQGGTGIISGFTSPYADLNGSWALSSATTTQIVFIESGTHTDINPAITVLRRTTGEATVTYPKTYFKNVTIRDNIFPGPIVGADCGGHQVVGGLPSGLSLNFCDPKTSQCTWRLKNNLIGTAVYANYSQGSSEPYPKSNPDSSPTCTVSGGCFVKDFSSVFSKWGTHGAMGDTIGNDYHVTARYLGAGSDGKDLGADMSKLSNLITAYPHFTWYPLTVGTSSLTPCARGVFCAQQLLTSSSATTPTANGFVRWHLISGSLPTGMNLANGDGYATCQLTFPMTGGTVQRVANAVTVSFPQTWTNLGNATFMFSGWNTGYADLNGRKTPIANGVTGKSFTFNENGLNADIPSTVIIGAGTTGAATAAVYPSGATGCQGYLWGTPTTAGSYLMIFQVEDAAHQAANVSLTLNVTAN